jgi:hypothetical protein
VYRHVCVDSRYGEATRHRISIEGVQQKCLILKKGWLLRLVGHGGILLVSSSWAINNELLDLIQVVVETRPEGIGRSE